jgi:hypothetical protein
MRKSFKNPILVPVLPQEKLTKETVQYKHQSPPWTQLLHHNKTQVLGIAFADSNLPWGGVTITA